MKKIIISVVIILSLALIYYFVPFNFIYQYNIESNIDYDNDNINDYQDILEGALKEAENHPKYVSAYYDGGYPPENIGVCTDMIWRSLRNAGYDFKNMIDSDIKNNKELYKNSEDSNIDFRRVRNLKVYFENNSVKLTNDIYKRNEWNKGDIVIISDNHIGIISDKRSITGVPFLIHNNGQIFREENILEIYNIFGEITGHYRMEG